MEICYLELLPDYTQVMGIASLVFLRWFCLHIAIAFLKNSLFQIRRGPSFHFFSRTFSNEAHMWSKSPTFVDSSPSRRMTERRAADPLPGGAQSAINCIKGRVI